MARPATRQPSTSLCGSFLMISLSLQVPGSPSSAFTTRYFGLRKDISSDLHETLSLKSSHCTGGPKSAQRKCLCISQCPHWPAVTGLVHEAPLHASRETSTASATQTWYLDLIEDPVDSLEKDLLGFVPVTTLQSSLQPEVQIWRGEDTAVFYTSYR